MNRFTREVDRLFETYGPNKKIIILCSLGDDGYEEWGYYAWSKSDVSVKSEAIDPDDKDMQSKFDDEKDKFDKLLIENFGKHIDFDELSKDCDYDFQGWIFVTRDYKVCFEITNKSLLSDEVADKVLFDMSEVSEDDAGKLHDRQINDDVEKWVNYILEARKKLESEEGKEECSRLIYKLMRQYD
jgi:hypothetical protein